MYEIECPYCGEINEYDDEELQFEDEAEFELLCPNCDKYFIAQTSICVNFEPKAADCLNTGEHKWKPTITVPRAFTRMRCECCGQEREPTEDERKQYEIPSRADYIRELNKK